MKKWTLLLVLMLCLSLVMPSALAEQAAYTPGEITSKLVGDAFASGQMVGGSMMIALDLDEEMLASSDAEKAEIQMVEELFSNTVLSGAIGLPGDVLRLELGASYGPEDNYAYADVSADLTLDGLTLESSLIPGEKVTASWETVLQLAGVSDSDIAMIMSLKELDIDALMNELLAQLGPVLELVGQAAAPYGETFVTFVSGLPITVEENLPADDVYPAAAMRVRIPVTEQDLGRLLTAYADQLEQDATLAPLLDMALQELASQNPESALRSTAELCAQVRALAGQMTSDIPVVLVVALDEAGMPAYVELYDQTADDSGFYAGLLVYPGETPNSAVVSLSFYTSAAGGDPIASFNAVVAAVVDPADAQVMDFSFAMEFMQGGMTLMTMEMATTTAAAQTEDGMPAYMTDVAMIMNMNAYGETGSAEMTGAAVQQKTAEGGEYIYSESTMSMDVEGQPTQQITAEELLITPVGDGFTGAMTEMVQMPDQGMTMAVISEFGSWQHQPAALTELALETATNDDFDALIGRLSENGMNELNKLMQLLPQEVVQMLQ